MRTHLHTARIVVRVFSHSLTFIRRCLFSFICYLADSVSYGGVCLVAYVLLLIQFHTDVSV